MSLFETTVSPPECYEDAHLSIDFRRQSVRLDGVRVSLPRKEFDLLAFLVRHAGELSPREALLMAVWGYGAQIHTRTLDVHIRRLRQNLGRYGKLYIETIFGVGYRFQPCRAQVAIEEPDTSSALVLGATAAASQWRWKMEGNTTN